MTALELIAFGGLALLVALVALALLLLLGLRAPQHVPPPPPVPRFLRRSLVEAERRHAESEADLNALPRELGRKLGALALVLAVLLPGCASLGGPRHVTAVSLAGTAGVLETFVQTERQLVCGQPAAPQAPRCVPVPTHLQIMSHVERAATLGAQASRVMASLPRGTPQPAEVVTMLVQVQGLLSAAYALIPQSQDKAALGQAIGVGGAK